MPQFSYSAVDAAGRTVQGVVDAATENDLIVRLSGQGLRIQSFKRGGSPSPAPAAGPAARPTVAPIVQSQPAQRAPMAAPPVQRPQIEMASSTQVAQLSARP